MSRFKNYRSLAFALTLVCLIGWVVDQRVHVTRWSRVTTTRLAGSQTRRPTARPNEPTASASRPLKGQSLTDATKRPADITQICSAIENSSDRTSLEERYCDSVAPWIATNSHLADKAIRELNVSPGVRLRLEAQLIAERDFASAYQWADRLPDPNDRSSALSSVLYEASLDAPKEVLDFARQVDLGTQRDVVLRTIVLRWSQTDYNSAMEWLSTFCQPSGISN